MEKDTMTAIMYNLKKYLSFRCLMTISIWFWTSYAQLGNTARPEIIIPQGTLQGITLTTNHRRNFSGFLRIPYAQPPVKNLRFANPVGADGWNGTRDASVDVNWCPQILGNVVVGEEDCLYLNVYTPRLPKGTNISLLPVMVFFHGGQFNRGNADCEGSPVYLLDANVVLVIPNYRLGPLGFLSTGDEAASGNWGLKDQVLALKWVQDNIHYFGGDPDQVTLFGISAGSVSVHLLTLSNSTNGLFHRYITQSGSALATWAHQPRATYSSRAFELGEYVRCFNDTSDSLINCLRSIEFSDIIATYSKFLVWQSYPAIVWSPTDEPDIEGAILTDSPSNLFAMGKIRDLPWISGVVRDEGLIFSAALYEDEEMFNNFLENIDSILPEMLTLRYQSDSGTAWVEAIKSYYFNNDLTTNTSALLSNFTLLINDALFFYPAYNALRQHLPLAKNPAYFYTFNYRGSYSSTYEYGNATNNYSIAHSDDIHYLFSPELIYAKNYEGFVSETDLKMVDIMVQLWTSFATNGIPTTLALNDTATWEPFSIRENYLRIGNESDVTLEVQYSFHKQRMQFWTELETNVVQTVSTINSQSNSFLIYPFVYLNFISLAATANALV